MTTLLDAWKMISEALEAKERLLGSYASGITTLEVEKADGSKIVGIYSCHDDESITITQNGEVLRIRFPEMKGYGSIVNSNE